MTTEEFEEVKQHPLKGEEILKPLDFLSNAIALVTQHHERYDGKGYPAGLKGEDIGMGNEKAINQLIAHHSIIFKPEELKVWITTSPFQLGEFVCYDLNKVFTEADKIKESKIIYETGLTIPADSFLYSDSYKNFIRFKEIRNQIQEATL